MRWVSACPRSEAPPPAAHGQSPLRDDWMRARPPTARSDSATGSDCPYCVRAPGRAGSSLAIRAVFSQRARTRFATSHPRLRPRVEVTRSYSASFAGALTATANRNPVSPRPLIITWPLDALLYRIRAFYCPFMPLRSRFSPI